ncbi:MAG: AmmeMemoRadiSam system protein B, partial [Gammaproteobacteria bacterium]|nr:AmmeMemoRadiSam system protein B [Gammaproteobacteria bacterium]
MNECGQIPGGTRLAAVAGYFYPDNPGELELALQTCLDAARSEDPPPKAIIAPHAGYIYSGPVAASAYCHFRTCADRINRVVLLGPAHRVYLQGMALSSASEFRTPLGDIRIDTATAAELLKHPDVCIMDAAHRQ